MTIFFWKFDEKSHLKAKCNIFVANWRQHSRTAPAAPELMWIFVKVIDFHFTWEYSKHHFYYSLWRHLSRRIENFRAQVWSPFDRNFRDKYESPLLLTKNHNLVILSIV